MVVFFTHRLFLPIYKYTHFQLHIFFSPPFRTRPPPPHSGPLSTTPTFWFSLSPVCILVFILAPHTSVDLFNVQVLPVVLGSHVEYSLGTLPPRSLAFPASSFLYFYFTSRFRYRGVRTGTAMCPVRPSTLGPEET